MSVIFILLLIAMIATFLVMTAGIVMLARGGEVNQKYGNKLMQWRVLLQGISIALLALLFMSKN